MNVLPSLVFCEVYRPHNFYMQEFPTASIIFHWNKLKLYKRKSSAFSKKLNLAGISLICFIKKSKKYKKISTLNYCK